MSWSFGFGPVPREQFDAAVDAAQPSPGGQDPSLPGVAEDVAAAKAAAKALAVRVKRPNVAASASGHCLQADEGGGMSDGISVSVYGAEAPTS